MADQPQQEKPFAFDPKCTPMLARRSADKALFHVYHVNAKGKWFVYENNKEVEIDPADWERP